MSFDGSFHVPGEVLIESCRGGVLTSKLKGFREPTDRKFGGAHHGYGL